MIHATPSFSASFVSCSSGKQHRSDQVEKSVGVFSEGAKPRKYDECVEDALLEFIDRCGSNERAADVFGVTEKTIRNWKTFGVTRAALRVLNVVRSDPALRSAVLGD